MNILTAQNEEAPAVAPASASMSIIQKTSKVTEDNAMIVSANAETFISISEDLVNDTGPDRQLLVLEQAYLKALKLQDHWGEEDEALEDAIDAARAAIPDYMLGGNKHFYRQPGHSSLPALDYQNPAVAAFFKAGVTGLRWNRMDPADVIAELRKHRCRHGFCGNAQSLTWPDLTPDDARQIRKDFAAYYVALLRKQAEVCAAWREKMEEQDTIGSARAEVYFSIRDQIIKADATTMTGIGVKLRCLMREHFFDEDECRKGIDPLTLVDRDDFELGASIPAFELARSIHRNVEVMLKC
tara:strand:+ start:380 stop:1273 length:894 start_codon:yes stop_codon:yes gene_type:complete